MMRIVQGALKTVGLKPTQEEVVMGTAYMLNLLTQRGRTLVDQAPNTLFVFAAGNEGLDNDKFPTFPTNIVGDNVLSVAATFEFAKLASFSNYGAKMVDVAAPGVLINSYIPGDKRMKVSGTSQASPYVAGVAAAVKEANPRLRPKEIKAIIMGTVDVKDFLKGKVRTGGIVNRNRALYAAALSRSVSVRSAIIGSRSKVADVRSRLSRRSLMRLRALPVQLSPVIY
jgi:subtilisin family serine protease